MRTSHYETHTKSELSERQREVLKLIAKGRSNPQIAEALGITLDGAKFHVSEILAKLEVSSREEAGAWWRGENRLPARMSRRMRALWAAPLGRIAVAGSGVAVAAIVVAVVSFAMVGRGGDSPGAPADEFVFEVSMQGGPQRVITYDAGSRRIVHSFALQPDFGELLARGGYLFAGLQQRELRLLNDDGSVARVLYTAPAGEQIIDVTVSPDRRTLALQQRTATGTDAALVMVDVASGRVIQTFALTDLAPGVASPSLTNDTMYWHDDSQGLTVLLPMANLPAHEGPTPEPTQATLLSLDGSVQRVRVNAMAAVSPNGSMVIEGVPTDPGCVGFYSTHALAIVDLATGKTLASVQDTSKGLTIDAWEPDGFAAIYSSSTRGGCAQSGSDYRSWSLTPDASDPQSILGDPMAQLTDPIASRVTFSCFGNKPQSITDGVTGPLVGQGNSCELTGGPFRGSGAPTPTPAPVGTGRLYVDGNLVEADIESFVFLGVVSSP